MIKYCTYSVQAQRIWSLYRPCFPIQMSCFETKQRKDQNGNLKKKFIPTHRLE